jgi:hypothetical protein
LVGWNNRSRGRISETSLDRVLRRSAALHRRCLHLFRRHVGR